MPPIDFCNRVAPRAHACEPPNPTSRCLRSDHSPAARPLAGRNRPISADPGVARRRIAVSTPARRPLVVRIYPSSTSSRTPSCRDADTGGDWKVSPAATCGRGTSLAGGSTRLGSARPRPGHDLLGRGLPLGPLPFGPREWPKSQLHPGCLPPIPSSRRCADGASWSEGRRLGRRVSPVRRSLPARHLFHRSFRGPDWIQGAVGSNLAACPRFWPGAGSFRSGGEARAAEATPIFS